MAEGVPTNNQRGQISGPCRLWGGLDKARHIVPTALLVRVQCFRKGSYKAVEGPSTRPIVLSLITGSYCRRRRRLTIFEPDERKLPKNPALTEVQRYVFDSLLKHQSTRDNTFALIRSCGNEVYKVEKSKEDTRDPRKLRSRNSSMTTEEFLMDQEPEQMQHASKERQ